MKREPTELEEGEEYVPNCTGEGNIEYVNSESGYGFIVTEDAEKDVLFRRDAVEESNPAVGQEVTFDIVQTKDGPRAMNVRRV